MATAPNVQDGTLSRTEAVERAVALARRLEPRRARTEELRRLPDETVRDFVDSGLLRINQSARWGGQELGVGAALDVIFEVSKADAAAGWALAVLATHFWLICLFPEEVQHEIWDADPNVMMSSSFVASEGRCERAPGGYRISGRWPFSSGSPHCEWAMVGMLLPAAEPNEAPAYRWGLLPRGDYEVDDDWRTISLRGTASNTLVVEDAFVPDHRTLDPADVAQRRAPGTSVNPAPLFRLPFGPALVFYLAAPSLGGATRVFEDWVATMGRKRAAFTGEAFRDQLPTVVRIGEVSARLDAAQTVMAAAARSLDDVVASGEPLPPALGMRAGRDATFAVRLCVEVVDTCMQFAGGSALFESNDIQKGWRDVHGTSAHYGFNTDFQFGTYGRWLMGLPIPPGMF
jgi:3-hydroxy-9,10-secoandrosta-1,3,5(10)-triene-9,17-dione monooxygenase